MAKRLNILLSDRAYQVIKKYQESNRIANKDTAMEKFILENAKK